jgi:hypothetical protein
MPEWTEFENRLKRLEDLLGNEQTYYVRRETLGLMLDPIKSDVASIRKDMADARREQADERRSLRNIVVGSLVSGIVSIIVAITVAALLH